MLIIKSFFLAFSKLSVFRLPFLVPSTTLVFVFISEMVVQGILANASEWWPVAPALFIGRRAMRLRHVGVLIWVRDAMQL